MTLFVGGENTPFVPEPIIIGFGVHQNL